MTKRSEFAEMLAKALDEAGYKHGNIQISEKEFTSYRDLSPKQIAEQYARDHLLKEIGKVFTFINYVYNLNQKGEYTGRLRETMDELGMDFKYYLFIFRHVKGKAIHVTGLRAQTTWTWLPNRTPEFEDAVYYYSKLKIIKSFKLTYEQRQLIDQFNREDIDTIVGKFNLTSEDDILSAKFKTHGIVSGIRSREKNKVKPAEHTVTTTEYRTVKKPETFKSSFTEVQDNIKEPEKKEKGKIEKDVTPSQKYMVLKGELFLACQKSEMYKAIIQNQDEHLKLLEAEMLSWYKKYHKLKKKMKIKS